MVKIYERATKHTNFVLTFPRWALIGRALLGRALMGPSGLLWPGPSGLPWALVGRALMGRALMGSLGPCELGPYGPGPYGLPWALHLACDFT